MAHLQTQNSEARAGRSDFLLPPAVSVPTFKEREAVGNLYAHQINAIRRAAMREAFALFMDCGLGKTRTALEIFREYRKKNPILKMLVVCPLSLVWSAWGEDVKKFAPEFSFQDFKKTNGAPSDIVAINYESFISKKYFEAIKSILQQSPYLVVCDESSRMKSFKSITSKKLLEIAPLAAYKIIMSGTPMPNSEMELWPQISFLDDKILPKSFYAFRNIYFQLERNGNIAQGQVMGRAAMREMMMRGFKYGIKKGMREKLMEQIAPFCDWVKKEDALDLPEKIDEVRDVDLNSEERKHYNELRRNLITEMAGSDIVAQVALAKIMKLRQIASGFAYDADGVARRIAAPSKMSELKNVLEELGGRQVIVWVQFREEVEQIRNLLREKADTLYSETPDREGSIKRFQNGEVQYLIAHPKSAAHGLSFQNCDTQIFYSLDYSWESHEQARNRIHRIGQINKCLYIYLIAKNTIDETLLKVLRRKQSLQDAIHELVGKKYVTA